MTTLKVPKLYPQDLSKRKLKAYSAFSREAGPIEGAILVFAHTWRDARDMAWDSGECFNVDDWLDQGAKWLRESWVFALADQEKLRMGLPHIVTNPVHCQACNVWGAGLDKGERCGYCGENPGEELIELIRGYNATHKQ